jgi:hypothetical protein
MMERQRIERPIGISDHMDSAVLADDDGHFRAGLAARGRGLSGVQDLVGMLGKPAHMMLIGQNSKNLSRIARCGARGSSDTFER